MEKDFVRTAVCPKCGKVYCGVPALSRSDNETQICPDCGTREALDSIGVDVAEQEQILDIIHRNRYRNAHQAADEGFALGSVPIAVAARVYGKDASWVRAGIIAGWLPIGSATRNGELVTSIDQMDSKYGRINYYISPKLLYEHTGYVWTGKE